MSSPEAEDANIVLIDIVHYSDLPGRSQVHAIEKLTKAVRESTTVHNTSSERVFYLPTGDGMIVGFLGHPERPLELAREIHRKYAAERFSLKIGIHAGYTFSYNDVNGNPNWAGSSINLAQRVESCCEGGHILVAEPPADRLHDLYEWKPYLHGPYVFRVKRGKELRAYNFYDEEQTFGNVREPLGPSRVVESDFLTLSESLAKRGVVPLDQLRDQAMRSVLGDRLAIDDAILDLAIRGFAGVLASDVRVNVTDEPPLLPEPVRRARSLIPQPESNRPKAFLAKLSPPVSDQGDVLTLTVGKTDYWNALAVEQALEAVHGGIASGAYSLFELPRQLCCHVLVLTADSKLVVARRAEYPTVRYRPCTWGATLGESVDAERDQDDSGTISVAKTVEKALGQTEELGLPSQELRNTSTKFIAVVTEWNLLLAVLIAVVKLWTTEALAVREYCRMTARDQGEISALDWVDFTIDACLPLVISGRYCPSPVAGSAEDSIYGTSRLAILAALCSEFGYGSIIRALKSHQRGAGAA